MQSVGEFTTLFLIISANLLISLASLVGLFTLYLKKEQLKNFLLILVSLSAGTLLGGAFFHLIPEASSHIDILHVNTFVIIAFILFFLLEKFLHWHHHHAIDDKHVFGNINLVADALHNILDGIIIAGAFSVSINAGIVTSLIVFLHEIPQELGDFGVLLHSGFSIKRAILANLLVSLTSLLGALFGYLFLNYVNTITPIIMSLASGGFIYLATSDLLPEIKKERYSLTSWYSFIVFLLGILFMLIIVE
jgi:zinc and cadmium transporter